MTPHRSPSFGSPFVRLLARYRSAHLVLADQALVSAVNFITTVILVRAMGLEGFGIFSYVWMLVLFAVGLQQSFLSLPLLTIGPKQKPEDRRGYFASTLALQSAFSVLVFVLVWAGCSLTATMFGKPFLAEAAFPIALLVCAKQAHSYTRSYFFATDRRFAALVNDVIAYLGQLIVIALLLKSSRLNLTSAMWSIAGCSFAAVVVGLIGYEGFHTTRELFMTTVRRHWAFSRWLVAKSILQWFSSNYFLIAAGALLGSGALGALKAAQSVLGVLHVFFLAMENVVPVRAAKIHVTEGLASLTRYMERLAWSGTVLTILTSVIFITWPHFILELLYGEATPELVTALRGFAVLYVVVFEVAILQLLFRTLEETKPIFIAFGITSAVAVVLAYPVVEQFGLIGVVAGMIGQQLFMAGLLFLSLGRMLSERIEDAVLE